MFKLIALFGTLLLGFMFLSLLVAKWMIIMILGFVALAGVIGFTVGMAISGGNEAVALLLALGSSGLVSYRIFRLFTDDDKSKGV